MAKKKPTTIDAREVLGSLDPNRVHLGAFKVGSYVKGIVVQADLTGAVQLRFVDAFGNEALVVAGLRVAPPADGAVEPKSAPKRPVPTCVH